MLGEDDGQSKCFQGYHAVKQVGCDTTQHDANRPRNEDDARGQKVAKICHSGR